MHPRAPPWKDMLQRENQSVDNSEATEANAQVGVNTGDACIFDSLWQRRKESFRLPLVRVLAPHRLVRVARPQVEDRDGALGDRDFRDERAVRAPYGFLQRQDAVLHRAGSRSGEHTKEGDGACEGLAGAYRRTRVLTGP